VGAQTCVGAIRRLRNKSTVAATSVTKRTSPGRALESSPAEPVLSLPKETAGKRFEKDGVPLGTAEWQPISRPCRDCSSYRWLYPACLPAIFNRA